ncbi:hematopoietic progenitor cell antigen CD34 [Antennarius striatus]|uniref:hematopoietic progenitor cell antigen CD34 n=1 Tax=Antennarius striatus TaxID=241820 RepID=UPI0035AFFFAE
MAMWRMNGLWRKMAGVVLLCALLLSNEVICQDDAPEDATDVPADADAADASAVTDVPDATAAPDTTLAPEAGADPTAAAGDEPVTPAAGDVSLPLDVVRVVMDGDSQDGDAGPTAGDDAGAPADELPNVRCVTQDEISESNAVKLEVTTADCEETKRVILENPETWCQKKMCDLKIFQDAQKALVASDSAKLSALAEAFKGDVAKDKLGATMVESPQSSSPSSSSSGSSVFVGVLVSGLLAALAITIGYFKCQRRSDGKGARLAEEAYPADQENQGNTLVSVAPLNPPPETQEKPSVNGESTEAAKTQTPPPTNGHSTAKTADTEM